MAYMIAQKYRFHGHGSLNYLHRKGKTARAQYFGIKYVPNKQRDGYRVAVVVSKKVDNSAVVRNKIRRRLFELCRLHIPAETKQLDMAIMVYDVRVATIEHTHLEKMFVSALDKVINSPK